MALWHKADWHTNLPPFQGTQPDHVRVESSSCCCFPRELSEFCSPLGVSEIWLVWHVTCHVLLRIFDLRGIWVGVYLSWGVFIAMYNVQWNLIHGMWHVLLQSESVFELGGITMYNVHCSLYITLSSGLKMVCTLDPVSQCWGFYLTMSLPKWHDPWQKSQCTIMQTLSLVSQRYQSMIINNQ